VTPRILTLAAALAAILAGCQQELPVPTCEDEIGRCAENPLEKEPPRLYADPPFGMGFECVALGCETEQDFTIENRGGGRVMLNNVRLSVDSSTDFSMQLVGCDGELLEDAPILGGGDEPIELLSKETVCARVRYTPSDATVDEGALWIDWYDGANDFEDAVVERVELPITTRVLGDAIAAPMADELNFGFVELGTSRDLDFEIRNDAEGTAILEVSAPQLAEGSDFEFEVLGEPTPLLVNPGETAFVTIRFTPTSVDAFSAGLVMTTNDPLNPAIEVDLLGTAIRDPFFVIEEPADWNVDFGDVRVGELGTQQITVRNLGGQPLQVTPSFAQESIDAGFGVSVPTDVPLPALPPLGSVTFDVTVAPIGGGDTFGQLDFATNDPSLPSDWVDLHTYGIAPDANFDVSSLDFGDIVQSWTSEAQTVHVQNGGTGDLFVQGIEFEIGSSPQVRLVEMPELPYKIGPDDPPLALSLFVDAQTLGPANAVLLVHTDSVENPTRRLEIFANVVTCDVGCPTANGTPTCGSGRCEIAACFSGFHDTDGVATTGCECGEDTTPQGNQDVGSFQSSGANVGPLYDNDSPKSTTRTGTLHDGDDVDFYYYRAVDTSQFLSDDYRARVRLDFGPPGLQLCTRFADAGSGFGGENQRNCGGTRHNGGGNGISDDSQDVSVWVRWAPGASPVCGTYRICLSADEDRCD
jgi:hypothetical protein